MSLSNTRGRRGGEDVYILSFLFLALDGGECLKSHPELLTHKKNLGNG